MRSYLHLHDASRAPTPATIRECFLTCTRQLLLLRSSLVGKSTTFIWGTAMVVVAEVEFLWNTCWVLSYAKVKMFAGKSIKRGPDALVPHQAV